MQGSGIAVVGTVAVFVTVVDSVAEVDAGTDGWAVGGTTGESLDAGTDVVHGVVDEVTGAEADAVDGSLDEAFDAQDTLMEQALEERNFHLERSAVDHC